MYDHSLFHQDISLRKRWFSLGIRYQLSTVSNLADIAIKCLLLEPEPAGKPPLSAMSLDLLTLPLPRR